MGGGAQGEPVCSGPAAGGTELWRAAGSVIEVVWARWRTLDIGKSYRLHVHQNFRNGFAFAALN